jgi:hypothetical protein
MSPASAAVNRMLGHLRPFPRAATEREPPARNTAPPGMGPEQISAVPLPLPSSLAHADGKAGGPTSTTAPTLKSVRACVRAAQTAPPSSPNPQLHLAFKGGTSPRMEDGGV